MKNWLTTSELAALQLPGHPETRQGWDSYVAREGWSNREGKVRRRQGVGGGWEYHIDLLPASALAAYASTIAGKVGGDDEARLIAEADGVESATALALDHRDARLALLMAADRFFSAGVYSRISADQAFCALYNLKKLEVEPWVRDAVAELAPRSLRRWRTLRSEGQIGRLAVDRGATRRGKDKLDQPEVRAWILGWIAYKPHTTGESLHGYLKAQFPDLKVSIRSAERALSSLKEQEKVALTRITNPDAWKSKYEPSGENSNPATRLNELWMIDASPADVMLKDGRHHIYACIDRYSRRTIIYVTKTPRAEAVCLLLRRAFLAWGVPERIKTDNGSDFKAKRTVGLMLALEIEVNVARAYDPKAKAHVERVIKTFQHEKAADLAGFIGHSVADRKVIEERKSFAERQGQSDDDIFHVELDAKAFQAECDHWASITYEHRRHGGLNKKTPFQMAAEYVGKIRQIEDIRALDMLLAPIAGGDGIRTTTKKGVRVDNAQYLTPGVLAGERVFVRMDPADLGRVYLFAPDGVAYLGEGVCPELAGVRPQDVVAEFKDQNRELLAEKTREIRASLRDIKKNKPALAAEKARREAEAAGKLISFPKPTETFSTPALEAASVATAAPTRGGLDADGQAMLAQIEAEMARDAAASATPAPDRRPAPEAPARVTQLPETRSQRFRRARAFEEAIAAGVQIDNEDAIWLGRYQGTAEYAAEKVMHEEFEATAKR